VIYISHRFAEIAELCDRATVLRDGRSVGDAEIAPGVEDRLVEMMLGAKIDLGKRAAETARPGPPGARACGPEPRRRAETDRRKLRIASRRGAGRRRAGRPGAGRAVRDAGGLPQSPPPDDRGRRHARPFPPPRRRHRRRAELRSRQPGRGAVPRTLRAGEHRDALFRPPRNWGPLRLRHEKARVAEAVERLQIDTRAQGEVQRLSGGNQQKVTIGRWLAHGVQTLLLFDPTRGIDVRTKTADLPAGPRTSPNRARRSSTTPRNSRRCRWPATGPWSSSTAASSTSWRRRRRPRNA
jgi:ribose transport system ATP-binding protein